MFLFLSRPASCRAATNGAPCPVNAFLSPLLCGGVLLTGLGKENEGGVYLRRVGFEGELCPLQDCNSQNAKQQSDALGATSVSHQIKGEDGAMTGAQQVRPTLISSVFLIFIIVM